jgi:carboxymethylenebutenolidase
MRKIIVALAILFTPIIGLPQNSGLAQNSGSDDHAEHASTMSVVQDWAKARLAKSPRHQEWVQVKNGGRSVKSFVVYPEVKNKATAVIVIHEIFGMTDWVQTVADRLAEAGYIAIAPDLLSGMGPDGGDFTDRSAVTQAVMKLPPDQVTGDLNAIADYVGALPSCNGKVVVSGFCWGGSQSFRFATNRPGLKAAFVFYGTPPDKASLANIKFPVYGFYAGNDARVTSTVAQTTQDMKALGKSYNPVTYDGAGHGFMRAGEDPGNTNADNTKAHDAGWERWLGILKKV